jgi:hypothetical protein
VAFDDGRPKVSATLGRRLVTAGASTKIDVTVAVEDVSGVAQVSVWLLPIADFPGSEGELDPAKATNFAPSRTESVRNSGNRVNRFTLPVPTPKTPGDYFVVVRATDGSSQSQSTFNNPIRLAIEKPAIDGDGPIVADLSGVVVYTTGRPVAGVKVTVKDQLQWSASTNAAGEFKIPQVKSGDYTLLASGTVNARPVVGEIDVSLQKKADFEGVVVPAEWQLSKPPDD